MFHDALFMLGPWLGIARAFPIAARCPYAHANSNIAGRLPHKRPPIRPPTALCEYVAVAPIPP